MDTPCPANMNSEETFQIISDRNNNISITMKNLKVYIEISVNYQDDRKNHTFNKEYTFEEIKTISKFFLAHENIDEIFEDLIYLMNKNTTKVIEDIGAMRINIPLDSIKFKEITFNLNESENNENTQIIGLYKTISDLKTEIKDLKERLNEYEKYIPYLEEFKKKFDEKNNTKIIRNLNSTILQDNENYNITLKNWINSDLKIKAELLYRASRDGEDYSTFHRLCDNKGPTVVLAKLTDGDILGSYTPLNWDTESNWVSDPNMFVFSLTENKKCMKKDEQNNFGIYCNNYYGPESYFLSFKPDHNMKEPFLRIDDDAYQCNTQILAPGKKNREFYNADDVEVFRLIIG